MRRSFVRRVLLALAALLMPAALPAQDRAPPSPPVQEEQEEEPDLGSIVVTGSMRVRQGGAQDVKHFRSVAADAGMPRPESLTAEGLLGEYDLALPAARPCAQLFCLVTETSAAALPGRPADKLFVGLGFASGIDERSWRRPPLDLIAVVDKSGSMDGEPLARVRAGLRRLLAQMRDDDRLGIVLYGDEAAVHLQPTDVRGGRAAIARAIDRIESAGSTNMEDGLKVGFDLAFAERERFRGTVRLMLFTDEQPNVGATDANSFMGMAEAASRRGIGLTTIGVGVQFDAALATRIAGVRGGNLFFVAGEADVAEVFGRRLDTMVSELAHDLELTLRPAPGYRVSGVFGVPDTVMSDGPEGAVSIRVPTVFLSTKGGGLFATLAKADAAADLPAPTLAPGQPPMRVSLRYRAAADGRPGAEEVAVAAPAGAPGPVLARAHLLVDEYLSLREATGAFHLRNEPEAAYAVLNGLAGRLRGAGAELDRERKLVGAMLDHAAFYAGYGGERPRSLRHLGVIGRWEITDARGFSDLRRGDRLEFTGDREMLTFRKKEGLDDADETEGYEINEDSIHLVGSKLVMRYAAAGDRLTMRLRGGDARLALRRVAESR